MSATIDRSQPVTVTFTAEQWQIVMQLLAKRPYEEVAPFIGHIQQQCMRHAEALPGHMPMRVPGGAARPNGEEAGV
jgi:hypothetical protein